MQRSKQHKTAFLLGMISIISLSVTLLAYFSLVTGIDIIIGVLCFIISFISSVAAIILNKSNKVWWFILLIHMIVLIAGIWKLCDFTLPL